MTRVGISGSYGGLNLGDEAILEAILRPLRDDLGADVVVFSRDAADTTRRHRVAAVPVRAIGKDDAREIVRGLDLLILGGGGILYDDEAHRFLREVWLAHELGVPVVVYGVSAGPLRDPSARAAVRDALSRCAAVTVRDRHAQALLQDLGVDQPVRVTADPALLLDPAELPSDALRRDGLDLDALDGPLIGISVREPGPAAPDLDIGHYHALVANTADYLIQRIDAEIVFVPMERKMVDVQHSHAVLAKMQHAARARVLTREYSAGGMLALVGRFEMAIGMRLHFLIFAARMGVPFVALPYATKVSGFIEDLDLPAPPLAQLNAGTLIAHVDWSWDHRRALREQIVRQLPAVQARARENHRIVAELLAGPQAVACLP